MTLSRTARILIAALLVAAAAFFWVNFFNQEPLQAPLVSQPATATPLASDPAPGVAVPAVDGADQATPAVIVGDTAQTGAETGVADSAGTGPAAEPAGTAVADGASEAASLADVAVGDDAQAVVSPTIDSAPTVVDTAPPVIVTGTPTVVTRDLVVEDLPFLVTSPPISTTDQASVDTDAAERPQLSQRSNINPFSPIVVQTPPSAPIQDFVAEQPPASSEPVIEIVTNGAGQPVAAGSTQPASSASTATSSTAATPQAAAPTIVQAPPPRTVAPATSAVSSLPRPLPSGTLPTTPEILRDARSQASTPAPTLPDVGTLAALRVPDENQPLDLAAADGTIPSDGVVMPELIGPARPGVSATTGAPAIPLAVGVDQLSRYLRDNDVKFTGTVLGPLSVGVFRSNLYGSPVVLTLGQTLPDTDILLSDLRGYEARFSLGDRTQTLALDLRR